MFVYGVKQIKCEHSLLPIKDLIAPILQNMPGQSEDLYMAFLLSDHNPGVTDSGQILCHLLLLYIKLMDVTYNTLYVMFYVLIVLLYVF